MNVASSRVQVGLVAFGYGAVFALAAALLYGRHLQALKYPADASGGMWAAGDAFLWIFIICLFMIPTAFLIWTMAKFEAIYAAYSQFLLALSLTAPICLTVFYMAGTQADQSLGSLCLSRLLASPFVFAGIGISRLVARFDRAKRRASYALLIESLTMAVAFALLIHAISSNRR
jgi:hypothetical protein